MTAKDIERLIAGAEKASKRAIAPYSKYRVGAALLGQSGKIYTAFNVENPSLMLTMCAERIALYKAITEGESKIRAVAIVSIGDVSPSAGDVSPSAKGGYCFPCGVCRQALFEFAPDADIFLKSKKGIKRYSVRELLPEAFKK